MLKFFRINTTRYFTNDFKEIGMAKIIPQSLTLQTIVETLEKFAPTKYAEKWDNVGLLIGHHKPVPVSKVLLTNDLTEPVMKEAINKNIDLIISYHPPIFSSLKRITQNHWKERIVLNCIANNIAVYSPHTAWDCVVGGVNDWLVQPFTRQSIEPIVPSTILDGSGSGRIITTSCSLADIIETFRKHIGLPLQAAIGNGHKNSTTMKTIAVCAGSGSSVLKGVQADVYITGEMSHHDVLDANHMNTTVLLCNHSNSERGFLKQFKTEFSKMISSEIEILVAETDEDPIKPIPLEKELL